jgi:sec-independent protein translocase protein TatA
MFGLGMAEVLVILVIGLLLFGNRLPDLARSLGKTLVEFKREVNGLQDDLHR